MTTATKPRISLGGLTPLLDVSALDDAPPASQTAPRMALDLIDEDPNQPRQEFDPAKLQELADSIEAAGDVLQPISLRPNPDAPGRYIVNFGHRRVRASRLLGLPDIPYFVARKVDSFAQVIENEQRQNLSPMELGLFIRDRMTEGLEQQEIARRLGKSKGYISKAASLAEAPAVVSEAWRAGKLAGVTEAYELRNLHREYPETVKPWVAEQPEITRAALAELRQRLLPPSVQPEPARAMEAATPAPAPASAAVEKHDTPPPAKAAAAPVACQTVKPAPVPLVVLGEYKGQPLELDFSARPPAPGHFYGRRPGVPRRLTVPATDVRLVGFAGE